MKIKFQSAVSGGAYWEISYNNGSKQYIIGLLEMEKLIKKTKETIEVESSLGFEEHSRLIKLLNVQEAKT